jgi:adenylosuccinate synthase
MQQQHGHSDVLIGLQYGDEGKARVVDLFAKDYDIIARFNGGANAGHSIELDGVKVALNQIPSGIFYPDKLLYIGSGCAVNVVKLAAEIKSIEALGIGFKNRLFISSQASIVQPQHQIIDGFTGKYIGTTNNGIGLCYADRALRMVDQRLVNIRLADLLANTKYTLKKIRENIVAEQVKYEFECETENLLAELKASFEYIQQYVQPDTLFLQKQVESGKNVLFEGAQSSMLDPVKGVVPFVTGGPTIASSAYIGGDLSLKYHRKTIGVAKAIMSRVGHGPFASELGGAESEAYTMAKNSTGGPQYTREYEQSLDIATLIKSSNPFEVGQAMRVKSGEYGVVTKRPRRIGHLDLVQLNYSCRINGVDELVLTKTDMFNVYSQTADGKIVFVYGYELDGVRIDYVPADPETYYKVSVQCKEFDGFSDDISAARNYSDLPTSLDIVIKYIEQTCDCKIVGLGVGPERDQFIPIPHV